MGRERVPDGTGRQPERADPPLFPAADPRREHAGDRMLLQYPQGFGVIPAAAAVQYAFELFALDRQIQFAAAFEDRLRRLPGYGQGFAFFRQTFANTVLTAIGQVANDLRKTRFRHL